jgi:hypothetical protein
MMKKRGEAMAEDHPQYNAKILADFAQSLALQ